MQLSLWSLQVFHQEHQRTYDLTKFSKCLAGVGPWTALILGCTLNRKDEFRTLDPALRWVNRVLLCFTVLTGEQRPRRQLVRQRHMPLGLRRPWVQRRWLCRALEQ